MGFTLKKGFGKKRSPPPFFIRPCSEFPKVEGRFYCEGGRSYYNFSEVRKGANPQRVSTEIIIEIKQSYPGRMASNPFSESHRMCKVFPLGNDFLIENGHFRLKHKRNR